MKPSKAFINGYKRLKKVKVSLDRNLLAFVGQNEAGKSSFFQALLSLENSEPYKVRELSKDYDLKEKDVIVKVEYLLDSDDKEIFFNNHGIGNPRFYYLSKLKNGNLIHGIIGDAFRNKSNRTRLRDIIFKLINSKVLRKGLLSILIDESYENLHSILEKVAPYLDSNSENLNSECFDLIDIIMTKMRENIGKISNTHTEIFQNCINYITEFNKSERSDHPKDLLLKYLDKNRPEFIFFSNTERDLHETYEIEQLNDPPAPLENLLNLAGVDTEKLYKSIQENAYAKRHTIKNMANSKLLHEFKISWSQSDVFPQFKFDPDSIKILVSYLDTFTEVGERSDGLRQFIALKAFLALKTDNVFPVLLIDEAEVHLHYSAQSDLINVFERQKVVNSIYYSTHSAGCLPSDLGTGVRVISPIYENGKDTGTSTIHNSIWRNDGGFSPLLFAMGANVIAFTLARKAIIAEGPSETILLPRLFREANNLHVLDFQIAPGIASVSKENAKIYELEAAKVAYLVDGDIAGSEIISKLKKGGIDENKIFQFPEDLTVEDLVNPEILFNAIKKEFDKSGKPFIDINLIKKIPNIDRIKWFEKSCFDIQVTLPSKTAIAENIVKTPSDVCIFDPNKKDIIVKYYNLLFNALNV